MQVHLQKCVNMLLNIALLRWKHMEEISCDKEQADFLSNTLTTVQELLTQKLLIFVTFIFFLRINHTLHTFGYLLKCPRKAKKIEYLKNKTKPNLASYIIRRQLHTRN